MTNFKRTQKDETQRDDYRNRKRLTQEPRLNIYELEKEQGKPDNHKDRAQRGQTDTGSQLVS